MDVIWTPLTLLAVCGLLVRRKRKRLGTALVVLALVLLALLCVPMVSAALLIGLQTAPALDAQHLDPAAGAIVVLGGDVSPYAPEFGGGATVGSLTLERVRYGAELARQTGLPLLTSGGKTQRGAPPLAELMKRAIEHDFGVGVRWTETRSPNTRGNANESAQILLADGVKRVYVVTHAWHMPRARGAFERTGLEVVPAPTAFRAWPSPRQVSSWLPSARSLRESQWALHEWIGRVWYALRALTD